MPLFDCLSCDCFQPHSREHPERGGACHGKPPQPIFLGMSDPPPGALAGVQHQMQRQPVFVHVYTTVGNGDWCAQHPMFEAMRKARPGVPIRRSSMDERPLPGEVKPDGEEKPS